MFFRGLDLEKLKREIAEIAELQSVKEQLSSSLQRYELQRHHYIKENKRLQTQSAFHEEEVLTSLNFYNRVLEMLSSVRQEFNNHDVESENSALN